MFLTGLERKTALLQAGTFKNTLRLIPVPHQICKSTFLQNILAKTTIFLLLAKLPILAEAIRQSGLFRTLFQIDSAAAAAARVCKTRAGLLETSSRLARRAGRRSFIASLPHSFVRSFVRSFRLSFRLSDLQFSSSSSSESSTSTSTFYFYIFKSALRWLDYVFPFPNSVCTRH